MTAHCEALLAARAVTSVVSSPQTKAIMPWILLVRLPLTLVESNRQQITVRCTRCGIREQACGYRGQLLIRWLTEVSERHSLDLPVCRELPLGHNG